ncbi:kynureninase [Calidifontibacter terrae]
MIDEFIARAADSDAADPLAWCISEFVEPADGAVAAYLDGNSLGRPTKVAQQELARLITDGWGSSLIRSWTDGEAPWMQWPETIGDLIGAACLGAAAGQTVVADSTTVMLYKLARAGCAAAAPGRDEIVLDSGNFPTDRYVLEGIAAERGMTLRWIEPDPLAGVTLDEVAAVVGERTALVVLSHVAYRSAWIADMPAITDLVHQAGAYVLWDLCHSVGAVPTQLDDCGVDLAVGCTYKYLNGGPGAPAFGYVARRHLETFRQPVQGWMGRQDPFTMGPGYVAAQGIRSFVSGTPPVVGMVPVRAGVELTARAGIDAIREKSMALTGFTIEMYDALLAHRGVELQSPRDPSVRGGHVTLGHPDFSRVYRELWSAGVVPDFREPDGIRLGLAPLTTSFADVASSIKAIVDLVPEGA